jgi:hypothetical protein
MESPSNRLAALGAALRASGSTPAPEPAPSPYRDLDAAIARLRVALGTDEPEQLSGAELEAEYARMARRMGISGRLSGWREQPQCGGCKRPLRTHEAICPGCGYAGHGGYVGVPATTSHLERWR